MAKFKLIQTKEFIKGFKNLLPNFLVANKQNKTDFPREI